MTTKAHSMWFIQNNDVTDFAWTEAEHMFTYTQARSTQMLWWILFQQLTWASYVMAWKHLPDLPFQKDKRKRKTHLPTNNRHFSISAWAEDCCENTTLVAFVRQAWLFAIWDTGEGGNVLDKTFAVQFLLECFWSQSQIGVRYIYTFYMCVG